MIYKVTVMPKVARKVEAAAAEKGLTPEQFLVEAIERIVQRHEASEAQIPRMMERARARQAKIEQGKRIGSL